MPNGNQVRNKELRKLVSLIKLEGTGSLAFVIIDNDRQRQSLAEQVRRDLGRQRQVISLALSPDSWDLPGLISTVEKTPHVVVFVHGFEKVSLDLLAKTLNYEREAFAGLPFPVVMWMRNSTLTTIARQALDFWAWRNGVFDLREKRLVEEVGLSEVPSSIPGDQTEDHTESVIELIEEIDSKLRKMRSPARPYDLRVLVDMYRRLADLYRRQGDLDHALRAIDSAVTYADQLGLVEFGVQEYGQLFRDFAAVHLSVGAWDEAHRAIVKSIDFADRANDAEGKVLCAILQATLKEGMGDLPRAIGVLEGIKDKLSVLDNDYLRITTLRKLGNLLIYQRRWQEAIQVYGEAHRVALQAERSADSAMLLNNMGIAHARMGEHTSAIKLLQASLELKHKLGDLRGMAYTEKNLSLIFRGIGQQRQADRFSALAKKHSNTATRLYAQQASEARALRKFRSGDRDTVGKVLADLMPLLRVQITTVSNRYGLQEQADDLLQETLLRLMSLCGTFRGRTYEDLKRWALLVATSEVARSLRRIPPEVEEITLGGSVVEFEDGLLAEYWSSATGLESIYDLEDELQAEPSAESIVIEEDTTQHMSEILWRAIAQLSDEERDIVIKRYFESVPSSVVADTYGISLPTYRRRLWNVRKKLGELIERSVQDPDALF